MSTREVARIAVLVVLACMLRPSQAHAQNILFLHAFEANMPMAVKTTQGLIGALDGGGMGVKNQFYESLDFARNPGPEYRRRLIARSI